MPLSVARVDTKVATVLVAADGSGEYTDIQSGINALPAAGGVVYIKDGTYTISSTITIPSNVEIVGSGWNTIVKLAAAANVDVFNNSDLTGGNSNIVIRDLAIDGNKANQTTAGYGIYLKNVTNSLVSNVYVHDCYFDGIRFDTSAVGTTCSSVIENCYAKSNGTKGISVRYLDYFLITGCISESNGDQGFWSSSARFVALVNCIALNNTEHGIMPSYSSYDWVIANCVSYGNTHGISLASAGRMSVMNCYCEANGHGITILVPDVTVTGCIINANTSNGINVDPTSNDIYNVVISDNIIKNNGSGGTFRGIYLFHDSTSTYALTNVIIKGNQIYDDQATPTQNDGIFCGEYLNKGVQIIGNYVAGHAGYGIRCFTPESVIANNVIKNNDRGAAGVGGLLIEDNVTDIVVTGNRIYDDQTTKTQDYGIQEDTGADYNIIVANNCRGNAVTSISTVGVNDVVANNIT